MLRLTTSVLKTYVYQNKQIIKKVDASSLICRHIRGIHQSRPNAALPPIVLLVLRPVMKLSAMLFGRTIRKWWQRLPPDQKQRVLHKLRGKQTQITAGCTLLAGLGFFFYLDHIEEDPITKRKRFILYNDQQMQSIAEMTFENEIERFKSQIIPPDHKIYKRVVRVANKLLDANKTLPEISTKKWSVTVIDQPDVVNAFVLPHGKIMFFTGLLNLASNDDQLALVMSHEMAHALLNHMSENLSKVFYVEMILLVPLVILWALLPDVTALFSQWLSSRLVDIMIHLPFSRSIEREADVVGLELAARACYDIREAPVFWGKMSEINGDDNILEWLSTHPDNETRQHELADLIPAALNVRLSCSCPRLPALSAAQKYYTQRKKTQSLLIQEKK